MRPAVQLVLAPAETSIPEDGSTVLTLRLGEGGMPLGFLVGPALSAWLATAIQES